MERGDLRTKSEPYVEAAAQKVELMEESSMIAERIAPRVTDCRCAKKLVPQRKTTENLDSEIVAERAEDASCKGSSFTSYEDGYTFTRVVLVCNTQRQETTRRTHYCGKIEAKKQ